MHHPQALHLCKMTPDLAPDGFYHRVTSVPISSLPCLSAAAAVQALTTRIKAGPLAVVMRGLPGAGKTTLLKLLRGALDNQRIVVASADSFFEQEDGSYTWSREHLAEAHAASRKTFLDGLESKADVVLVDNTNSSQQEYKDYIAYAEQHHYPYARGNSMSWGLRLCCCLILLPARVIIVVQGC